MIVLDTSAIVSILLGEEDAPVFRRVLEDAGGALVSAVTAVELAALSRRNDDFFEAGRAFLRQPWVSMESVDSEQAEIASDAYRRYGKGRHPARLNLGDVFAYALARQRALPLAYKGNDFRRTDIASAAPELSG